MVVTEAQQRMAMVLWVTKFLWDAREVPGAVVQQAVEAAVEAGVVLLAVLVMVVTVVRVATGGAAVTAVMAADM
jgi:hypothetical protein